MVRGSFEHRASGRFALFLYFLRAGCVGRKSATAAAIITVVDQAGAQNRPSTFLSRGYRNDLESFGTGSAVGQ